MAQQKLRLYGFNNLTKSLSFNIYDVCYAKTAREQKDYIAYINEQYNSERLTNILTNLTEMIGAKVLSISKQDYEPQGASVTLLIAEESMIPHIESETVVAHLDKSHVTVHTYPEYHPDTAIATFRVDIDVATCGEISPLSTLDYLIGSFDSDIITMDYRVRGFTRDVDGKKIFRDKNIVSIQNYIDKKTLERYDAIDINVYQANMFHTKMLIKDVDLQNYLFKTDVYEIDSDLVLTSLTDLPADIVDADSGDVAKQSSVLPRGTKCSLYRTNGIDSVDVKAEDGTIYRFTVTGDWPQMVNGLRLNQAFEGTMFAG